MRPTRNPSPRNEKDHGPYGRAFYFAGQFPLPVWMQHVIVACGVALMLVLLPVLVALGIKNVSDGKLPFESQSGRIGRHIEEQKERRDPSVQAKQRFLAEQAVRPVLDVSEYEKMSTADLISAVNHAGIQQRLTVVRTLALSRHTALRLLPWCNGELARDPADEHAAFLWRAAVKLSGCDAAEKPSDWLPLGAALGLPGAKPLTSEQQLTWTCVLEAAANEESTFERSRSEIKTPE